MNYFLYFLISPFLSHALLIEEKTTTGNLSLQSLKVRNPGFLLSLPQSIISGEQQLACLTIHEGQLPVKIKIDIKYKDAHFYTNKSIQSEYSCFNLNTPIHTKLAPQYVSVKVQIQINGIVYASHNQDPIYIYPEKKHTFIETDKAIYKPGDNVKIRILTINENLLPPSHYKISEIRLRNPLDVAVAVWENISTNTGLVQLEHQLFQDAILGKWRIELDDIHRFFEVNKYVLPRFNINLTYPKAIFYATPVIEIKVCSKYSSGKFLKGSAYVKISDPTNTIKPIHEMQQLVEGCASFKFTKIFLDLLKFKVFSVDSKTYLHITATAIEYGTDQIELENGKILVDLLDYHIKFISDMIFYPGLPYHGKLQITTNHNKINQYQTDVIEICYSMAIKKSWNYLNNEQCKNFSIVDDNFINFTILPLKSNVIHIKLTARSLNNTSIIDNLLVVRLYSPENNYIVLKSNNLNKNCGQYQQFMVLYTTDNLPNQKNITFYSIIKTRGRLHSINKLIKKIQIKTPNYGEELKNSLGDVHKYTSVGSTYDKFVFKFALDEKILSRYQILLYYIANNGEIVSATKEIERGPCFLNKVEAYWSQKQIHPGEKATLNIKTSSNSLCAISAIDESVNFMKSVDNVNSNLIVKYLNQERLPPQSNRKTCISPKKTPKVSYFSDEILQENDKSLKRGKRFIYPFSEDFDVYDMMNKFGTVVVTNLKLITKQCYTGPKVSSYNPAPFLTDQYDLESEEETLSIRSFFPETWLWELAPVRSHKQIQRNIPHSVTNWSTHVLCISPREGIGMMQNTEIIAFQPFFINILTPYSIKRGEVLHLRVLIFNYMKYSIPIKITFENTNGITLLADKSMVSYCLPANDTIAHVFPITGYETGDFSISVICDIDPLYPGYCGPETIVNMRDVVIKNLKIEPEGYQKQLVTSTLVCLSDITTMKNISWTTEVPKNIIPNTAKAKLSINADLLGQSLENLEDLLQIPVGCGEQIMATLSPNLHILKYLNNTNRLTPNIKQKIIKNMKIGYHKILNYVLKDGSFAPFGYHDPFGSMFLTAFVIKTLQSAKEYIYVDQRIIDRAVNWILNHQLENGCFDAMLHVFQEMGDTISENSTSALTSYVIISLLDAKIKIPDNVLTNAKYCIRGFNNPDKYTLAISSYSLFKIGWDDEAIRLLKRLLDVAKKENNMLWWVSKDTNGSEATDIEITSYVLLSLLQYNTSENLAYAQSVVRWLTSKKGPYGGFKSTQDTVVALEAISKYSQMIRSTKTNLDIDIQARRQHFNYQINDEDRLKTKKITLKEVNNTIEVKLKGEGCVLLQSVLSFYIKNVPRSESFKIAMEVSPVSTVDRCSIAKISPCISYTGPDLYSNMVVLDVSLPSGYQADRASLYKLIQVENESKVKMFEEINDRVIFYFTKLETQQQCFSFMINEESYVEGRNSAIIKLYDYYKPDYGYMELYKVQNCGDVFNNETKH